MRTLNLTTLEGFIAYDLMTASESFGDDFYYEDGDLHVSASYDTEESSMTISINVSQIANAARIFLAREHEARIAEKNTELLNRLGGPTGE